MNLAAKQTSQERSCRQVFVIQRLLFENIIFNLSSFFQEKYICSIDLKNNWSCAKSWDRQCRLINLCKVWQWSFENFKSTVASAKDYEECNLVSFMTQNRAIIRMEYV